MYFPNYGLQKTWLDNCIKKRHSEHPLRSNIVNVLENFRNLNDSALIIFIDPWEAS